MNYLSRNRCALSVCVAAIVFTGCGGSNGTSPQPIGAVPFTRYNNGEPSSRNELNGGTFSGAYSGTYHAVYYGCTIIRDGHFNFHGTGRANFLHRSKETGRLTIGGTTGACYTDGTATLRSAKHPRDTITVSVKGEEGERPCYHSLRYSVKQGTGKFVNASGFGTVTFKCVGSSTYSDQWSGTLYY
jgi:hypothetical protein